MVYLPIGFASRRFAVYPEIFLLIGLADLVGRAVIALGRVDSTPLRVLGRAAAVNFGLFGFIFLQLSMTGAATPEGLEESGPGGCDLRAALTDLHEGGWSDRPRIILAHPDLGSRLLYFTDHAVVGSSYHRNDAGLRDVLVFLRTGDPETARDILRRRGVDLVLACEADRILTVGVAPETAMLERLLGDRPPAWLRQVHPSGDLLANYKIFEVLDAP